MTVPLVHGGTIGLVLELAIAGVVAGVLVWAAWKSRRDPEDDERRP